MEPPQDVALNKQKKKNKQGLTYTCKKCKRVLLSYSSYWRHKKKGCTHHNTDHRRVESRQDTDTRDTLSRELPPANDSPDGLQADQPPVDATVDEYAEGQNASTSDDSCDDASSDGSEVVSVDDMDPDSLAPGVHAVDGPDTPLAVDMMDVEQQEEHQGDEGDEGDEGVEDDVGIQSLSGDSDDESMAFSESDDGQDDASYVYTMGAERWEQFVGSQAASYTDADGVSPYEVRQRDAKFYLKHLLTPLYPGSRLSVIGACYVLANEKIAGRVSDKTVDRMCRYMADVALPEGNLHPPSLYLLKKCLRVEEAHKFEQHVCINDCHRFPKVHRSKYHEHLDDKCPHCEHPRFHVVSVTSGTVIKPYKVFWDLGVARTLQEHFFSQPEFCEQRGQGREKYDTDYYKSEEASRLDQQLDGALMKLDNSAWEAGLDFYQPFLRKTHSTGIVCIR